MIEISNINKTYKSKAKEEVKAISGVNLQFSKSGLVFFLGKSGSGKSTFLNILGGLDSANTSRIFINKKKLDRFDETTCSQYRNSYIGFVFQEYNLLDELNVYKNVELALKMQGKTDTHDTILRVLQEVGLEGLEERELDELSGGQKQRVAVARALVKDPTIILADEPTGNLDSETSEQIFDLFKELSKKKLVIVVSHDAEYAAKYADRIIEISDGVIIKDTQPIASPDEVQATDMIKPTLPWDFIYKMSIGNIINNKLRMVVTSVIVAFLVAILSAVYTMLYVNPMVNQDLMTLSSQEHLLLTKTVTNGFFFNQNQNGPVVTQISADVLAKIDTIANTQGGLLYAKSYMTVLDASTQTQVPITLSEFSFANLTPATLTNEYVIHPDIAMVATVASTPLTFTPVTKSSDLLEGLIGNAPQNSEEIVISSYLADWLISAGTTQSVQTLVAENIQTYEDLINSPTLFTLCGSNPVKIVGVVQYKTPILLKETSALRSVANSIFVHESFMTSFGLTPVTEEYGVLVRDVANIETLVHDIKNAGSVTITPNYVDQLNRYTRYDLTLVISVLVPLLGYLALVFLGNYISSSIIFRRRQIGILRAIGNYIANLEHIFRLEAIIVGFIVMVLVYLLVPYFVNIVNFAFMVHFQDTFISLYHYRIYTVGIGSIVEIFLLLSLLITMLTFTLTHNLNLIDPVDVISGR